MEMFRLRETKEFLSIDELKEKCDTMDVFMEILKVRKCMYEHCTCVINHVFTYHIV